MRAVILAACACVAAAGTAADIAAFNEWFKAEYERDGLHMKVEVRGADDALGGYGVYALQDIELGELYLEIPERLLITEAVTRERGLAGDLAAVVNSPLDRLAVTLVYERYVMGPESRYARYIDALPNDFDTLQYYTKDELAELDGTGLQLSVRRAKSQWRELYSTLHEKVFSQNHARYPPQAFTWDNFKWGMSVLHTRCIWVGGRPSLVPMLDMINCRELPDKSRVHKTHSEDGFATTYAPSFFETGDEIFENYGQNNQIYFSHHGFYLEENSHDCLNLKFSLLGMPAKGKRASIEAILMYLKVGGWDKEHCVRPDFNRRSLAIFPALRAVASSAKKLKKYAEARPIPDFQSKISNTNDIAALQLIVDMCNKYLTGFPTSPAADAAILADPATPHRKRMAVGYRLSRKRLAMAIIKQAEGEMRALGGGVSGDVEL